MNFRNISIRSRFFLLVTGSVLFWLLAGFLIFSLNINPQEKDYGQRYQSEFW
jgi:hypothetical protein